MAENVNASLTDTNKDLVRCLGRALDGADDTEKEVWRLRAERWCNLTDITALRRDLDAFHESDGKLSVRMLRCQISVPNVTSSCRVPCLFDEFWQLPFPS